MAYERLLAAISGGVDSSVAALLARREGRHVEGLTLRLSQSPALQGVDLEHARAVCEALGIAHHVAEAQEDFEWCVAGPFAAEYLAGRTPNPCVICNAEVKFRLLAEWAERLGCDGLMTGHYARVERAEEGPRLLRATDPRKDQSYMLYRLSPETLWRTELPLGGLTKPEVIAIATEAGLPTVDRPESQDACFIPDGDVLGWISARHPEAIHPGLIVNQEGRALGEHRGLAAYTVGQRRGLGIGGPEGPLFVLELRPADNTVVVGPEEALWQERCWAVDVRMLAPDAGGRFEAQVMTRYRGLLTPASVEVAEGMARVSFQRPHRAPAPGQAAVFYQGERLIGGGTIARPDEGRQLWQEIQQR